jgi:NAD(P)-dependent dehydrogenase (short-subunit alcohol dehydrogenase family)
MDLGLNKRKFLITGGSSGLGLAAARSLVAEGADVAICGRSQERLDQAVSSLETPGQDVVGFQADVTEPEAFGKLREEISERWDGVLDGLVNNAGEHTSGKFEDTTDAEWYDDFDLKVMAILRGVREMLPLLRASSAPAVFNVLSVFAKYQYKNSMPSSMFRSAGLSATNALARDLAEDGIRVNAALIGFIHSDQWVRAAGTDDAQAVQEFEDKRAQRLGIPLGRAGRSEEFGDVAAFLLSPRASYLTGTALNVDGGLSPVI